MGGIYITIGGGFGAVWKEIALDDVQAGVEA
jgi:hypothetical protein